jgi:hypothetical protein
MTTISVARTNEGKDDKGRDKLYLKLASDMVAKFAAHLNELAAASKEAVIDIRVEERVNQTSGNTFPSAFLMLRETQSSPFAGNGGNKNYSNGTFKAKTSSTTSPAATQAKRLANEG